MMEQLTPVRSLFEDTKRFDGKTVKVGGWVRNLRASKNFGFINLSDGTYFSQVQVVFGAELANFQEISKLNISAAVIVTGTLVVTPDAKQPFEIQASEISVEGPSTPDFPIQPKRHSMEFLRTLPHLRPENQHLPGGVPRAQHHRLRHPQVLPGARLRLCPHAAHHRLRLRGRRRDVPGDDARPQQPAQTRRWLDRLFRRLLRQGDESDRVRSAERRGLRTGFPQYLHLRPDLPRRKFQHHAPRRRVLDDRARDGVCRPVGRYARGRGHDQVRDLVCSRECAGRNGVLQPVCR